MTIDEFARGAEHLEDRNHLAARLARGDRLRIKWGVDPTAPDIHLGHTVPMRRLRAWQRAGHLPVIVIGDWTARIGDPSGRNETRPPLAAEEVEANAATYLAQLFCLLDPERTEVRRQSEWYDTMRLDTVLHLCGARTVQQLLQRADFQARMAAERPIGVHELLYALLQGYDSVAVSADVEIGGTDQLFNLMVAREVQRHFGQPPQDVVTFPLLEGIDGVRKMSKSYGNYIGVTESPREQYGKAMSLPDSLIVRYMELATDLDPGEVERWRRALEAESVNPRVAKARLAEAIVAQFHGAEAARRAAVEFDTVHAGNGIPEELPSVDVATGFDDNLRLVRTVLAQLGVDRSGAEVRRLFRQGGVALRLPGSDRWERLDESGRATVAPGAVLRIGRRLHVRLVPVAADPRATAP